MTIRSITVVWSLRCSGLGLGMPALAQGQVQVVPRAGVSFANTVTVKGWVESVDPDSRTMVFTTPDGRLIDGRGGRVRTYTATSIAKQDMLKKIKVGDVATGLTMPLLVTAITPAK
jgi:hypothetical protein